MNKIQEIMTTNNNKNTGDEKIRYCFTASLKDYGEGEWDITQKEYDAMSYDEKYELYEKISDKIYEDIRNSDYTEFSDGVRIPSIGGESFGELETQDVPVGGVHYNLNDVKVNKNGRVVRKYDESEVK
jgi:hypothetical protein